MQRPRCSAALARIVQRPQCVEAITTRISCVPTLAGPWLAKQLATIETEFPDRKSVVSFPRLLQILQLMTLIWPFVTARATIPVQPLTCCTQML